MAEPTNEQLEQWIERTAKELPVSSYAVWTIKLARDGLRMRGVEGNPRLVRNEEACFTELVESDEPYIVEEIEAVDCALIRAMDDRRIIGLRIYTLDPAPDSASK